MIVLDYMNAMACAVLLVLVWPVANAMHNRGFWLQRIGLWLIAFSLGLQVCAPFFDFIPDATPLGSVFMTILAVVAVRHRHQVMAVVRLAVGEIAADSEHPMRRVEDLQTSQLMAVRGRGAQQ